MAFDRALRRKLEVAPNKQSTSTPTTPSITVEKISSELKAEWTSKASTRALRRKSAVAVAPGKQPPGRKIVPILPLSNTDKSVPPTEPKAKRGSISMNSKGMMVPSRNTPRSTTEKSSIPTEPTSGSRWTTRNIIAVMLARSRRKTAPTDPPGCTNFRNDVMNAPSRRTLSLTAAIVASASFVSLLVSSISSSHDHLRSRQLAFRPEVYGGGMFKPNVANIDYNTNNAEDLRPEVEVYGGLAQPDNADANANMNAYNERQLGGLNLGSFNDPKSVQVRNVAQTDDANNDADADASANHNNAASAVNLSFNGNEFVPHIAEPPPRADEQQQPSDAADQPLADQPQQQQAQEDFPGSNGNGDNPEPELVLPPPRGGSPPKNDRTNSFTMGPDLYDPSSEAMLKIAAQLEAATIEGFQSDGAMETPPLEEQPQPENEQQQQPQLEAQTDVAVMDDNLNEQQQQEQQQPNPEQQISQAVIEANLNEQQQQQQQQSQPIPIEQQQPQPNPEEQEQEPITHENGVVPFNIDNALATSQGFRYTLFFFVYDSKSDMFNIVHNIPGCDYGCARVYRVAGVIAAALKKNFPFWFKGKESKDLVFMMSTGDSPRIHLRCVDATTNYCNSMDFAPILQFGSVYVNRNFLPSMIAMPLPVRPHIPCFDEWQRTKENGAHGVCQDLQANKNLKSQEPKNGFIFGKELGMIDPKDEAGEYWNTLIPQIIWRGTDFGYLHTMFQEMRSPKYHLDIAPYEAEMPGTSPEDDVRWAIQTMWRMGDKLLPRWRGVLMTSEAESEAREIQATTGQQEPILPWINVKFASINIKAIKVAAAENPEYQKLEKLGITAIGEHVDMVTQAKYKYHIDLGGGGGTTWTGTIEKLALPGVLFHHVTPTKDWFHDYLVPWEHYVPVRADLGDLREKFEWAESHPEEARRISEAGTQFVRWVGSKDGFGQLYEERMLAPLRDILRAYKPMPPRYEGKSVLDVIMEMGEQQKLLGKGGFEIIGRCSGKRSNSCSKLV